MEMEMEIIEGITITATAVDAGQERLPTRFGYAYDDIVQVQVRSNALTFERTFQTSFRAFKCTKSIRWDMEIFEAVYSVSPRAAVRVDAAAKRKANSAAATFFRCNPTQAPLGHGVQGALHNTGEIDDWIDIRHLSAATYIAKYR